MQALAAPLPSQRSCDAFPPRGGASFTLLFAILSGSGCTGTTVLVQADGMVEVALEVNSGIAIDVTIRHQFTEDLPCAFRLDC